MYHISKIKFRGFKSFKSAEAAFPQGFVAIAGPNGSGKSNVADAIRFCFGEMGTKAIRVKRASELININSSRGEVTINLSGSLEHEPNFEVRRTISEDGKTAYSLNGKHLTRTNVLEALRPYGLEIGHHNIIAQGQVQRIVEMNAKDRRAIIDSVAGISEFDEKKKEALGELSKVEAKISEAKIVLSERGAYLQELEKEKDAAISHNTAKATLEQARATLLHSEYEKLNSQFDELVKKRAELGKGIGGLEKKLEEISAQKNSLETQRKELAQKMSDGGKKESLLSQIQDLKVQMAQSQALCEEKAKAVEELGIREKELAAQKEEISLQITQLSAQIKTKGAMLTNLAIQVKNAKEAAGIDDERQSPDEKQADSIAQKLSATREEKAALAGQAQGMGHVFESISALLKSAQGELSLLKSEKEDGEAGKLSSSIEQINESLTSLFEKEKSLNKDIPSLDRQMLDAKERVAALRGSVSPASRNPALIAVQELKTSKGGGGIFGPVADLISMDNDYQVAIEAAAGSRLNYVVVDSLDTADSIIKKLKAGKQGRCSFIPLDKVVFNTGKQSTPKGSLGRLIDFVQYSPAIDNAMRYLFEDTLLVQNVESAKKLGIGSWRMVTMGGELLERSGVITGGSQKSSLLSRASLKKAEDEIDKIKSRRDSLYSDLYSVRDEMQRLRRERASLELKLRTREAESGSAADKKARLKKLEEQASALTLQEGEKKKELEKINEKISSLEKSEKELAKGLYEAKEAAQKAREDAKKKSGDKQQHYRELFEKHASLSSEIDSLRQEEKMHLSSKQSFSNASSQLQKDKKIALLEIKTLEENSADAKKKLEKCEDSLRHVSASVQKYYNQMQELQSRLDALGGEEGQIKFSFDSQNRALNEINIKHASIETKLADVSAEWEKYRQVKLLGDFTKQKLEQMIGECEATINSLGMVNLRAPELYDSKKEELEQMGKKVETLQSERGAVISLMEEIELKKRKIFMDTFTSVNEHFIKLFGTVFKGEGSLVLDTPENPLDSGLSMRARGVNEKRDRYLESMSGGEKTLLSTMFIFSLQMRKSAPFYILDEAEAALDKANASKMADFLKQMSKKAQFIVITHHDALISAADVVLGVAKTNEGSKIVGVQLTSGSQFTKGGEDGQVQDDTVLEPIHSDGVEAKK